MTSITIDEEFRALIAPLKIDELGLLEAAIVEADGATDPLKTWNGLLLDGHHRFKICERLGLPYTTVEVEGIEDREQALRWIETNQLGRRNLSLDQRATIALRVMQRETALAMKERAKAAAEARWNASCLEDDATSKHPPGPTTMAAEPEAASAVVQQMQIPAAEVRQAAPKQRTRAAVALQQGIPERMLRSVAEIEKKDPPAIDRIVRGETTLVQERAKLNAAARAAIAANPPVLPTGKYSVIVVDPPWDMKKIDRDVRPNQVGFDYPTMSNDELIELPVDEWAYDDCHLFLWTTHRFLPNAFELLKHWGFRYVDTWVWMKPGGFQPIGLPQYNCEFALLD
jgi:MT-A70